MSDPSSPKVQVRLQDGGTCYSSWVEVVLMFIDPWVVDHC